MKPPMARPATSQTQPGTPFFAAGAWWRLAPRLGAGFFFAMGVPGLLFGRVRLHAFQSLQTEQLQALFQGTAGQRGETQAAVLLRRVLGGEDRAMLVEAGEQPANSYR